MTKFKLKPMSSLINYSLSPLNTSSTKWNPEKLVSTREEVVEGGKNIIKDYEKTGESNFEDSEELMPNEEYAKLKLDPEYIKKEKSYIEKKDPLIETRSETEFIPNDLNKPLEPVDKELGTYFYGESEGAGSSGRGQTYKKGRYTDADHAYNTMKNESTSDDARQYYELYKLNEDGEKELVKTSPEITLSSGKKFRRQKPEGFSVLDNF